MDTPLQMTPLDDPPPPGEGYIIDPYTILSDIDNGKIDIFKVSDEGMPERKYSSGSSAWSSTDYLEIAKANHLYLTGEPVSDKWKLFAPVDFNIYQCKDDMQGFDSATLIFYKRNPDTFTTTYINIFPLRNFVNSDYSDYYRNTYDDNWIEKLLFNPDDFFEEALPIDGVMNAERALEIAEEMGGAEMRHLLSNDGCEIRIKGDTDKWSVWYYWKTNDLIYTLSFDVRTDGSYKKREDLESCERTICP